MSHTMSAGNTSELSWIETHGQQFSNWGAEMLLISDMLRIIPSVVNKHLLPYCGHPFYSHYMPKLILRWTTVSFISPWQLPTVLRILWLEHVRRQFKKIQSCTYSQHSSIALQLNESHFLSLTILTPSKGQTLQLVRLTWKEHSDDRWTWSTRQ